MSEVDRHGVLIRQLQGSVGGSGYLSAAFPSISAGANDSDTVPHGLDGTPTFVYGSVTGDTALEDVSWGWQATATDVVIYVRNNGAGTADVEIRFRAVL